MSIWAPLKEVDQDANERDANEQDAKELVLCWNFPIFAEIFIDVLTNSVT